MAGEAMISAMTWTISRASALRRSIVTLALAIGFAAAGGGAVEAQPPGMPQVSMIELYPAPEEYRLGGMPPGMTMQTFMAASGVMEITVLDGRRSRLEINFEGLLPNGVYAMRNVLRELPDFADEALGGEGFGRHGFIADRFGMARVVMILEEPPGMIFLLAYHADGELDGEIGDTVFPGVLWGRFPVLD